MQKIGPDEINALLSMITLFGGEDPEEESQSRGFL